MTQSENQLINGMMELMIQNNFELSIKRNGNNVVFNLETNLTENNNVSNDNNNVVEKNENNNTYWTKPVKIKNKKKNKNSSYSNGKYFTPYMSFVKAIREKNPDLSNNEAKKVATNFRKEFPDVLKVSKNKFNNIIKTVDFNYYV